jgi:RND family efflux transporter MFP subunit
MLIRFLSSFYMFMDMPSRQYTFPRLRMFAIRAAAGQPRFFKTVLSQQPYTFPMSRKPAPLLALFLSLVLSGACGAETALPFTPEQRHALAIISQPLATLAASGARRLPAQVKIPPSRIEVITAPLGGIVTGVKVGYGDTVKKDQPLVQLQGTPLLEAQRDYAIDASRARLAAESMKRDEALYADGIIPHSRLAAARAAHEEAQAMLSERRQSLALAGLPAGSVSGHATLVAPFTGTVLEAPAEPGMHAEAGAVLMKLGRLDRLWLELQASASEAATLSVGDVVTLPGCAATARITAIASHLTPGSQSVLVRAELAQAQTCVKPSQTLEVTVVSGKRASDEFRIPTAALVRHEGASWIFVDSKAGFVPHAVTVLEESDQSLRIAGKDLRGDMVIAVKGVAAIKAAWLGIGKAEGQ